MALQGWYKSGEELLDEMKTTKLPEKMTALWFLGQAGIVVKTGNTLIAIDPYLEDRDVRTFPVPFEPSQADLFDFVICSHDHGDHLNYHTVSEIAKNAENTRFIIPAPHVRKVCGLGVSEGRIIPAHENRDICLQEGITVTPVRAMHDEFHVDENGDYEDMGFVIRIPGAVLYHSGDTVEWDTMVEDLAPYGIDVALLPINGSDWKRKHRDCIGNLNYREAADVAGGIGADLLIPLHFDLFANNSENPAFLVDYMHRMYPGRKCHVMVPGERFVYLRG